MFTTMNSKNFIYFLFVFFCCANLQASEQNNMSLKVGCFNIQYAITPDHLWWQTRKEPAKRFLAYQDFDIIGLQEIHPHQMEYLTLSQYGIAGFGKNNHGDIRGEGLPILYAKNRIQNLEVGVFWISETPEKFSKSWDSALVRSCIWGKFKHNDTGKTFYVFNTHLDHKGMKAREEGIKVLMNQISKIAGDTPFFLMGDFNIASTHAYMKPMFANPNFRHARDISETSPVGPNGSYHAYTGIPRARLGDLLIVSKDVKVEKFAILTERIGKHSYNYDAGRKKGEKRLPISRSWAKQKNVDYMSDHFPLVMYVNF